MWLSICDLSVMNMLHSSLGNLCILFSKSTIRALKNHLGDLMIVVIRLSRVGSPLEALSCIFDAFVELKPIQSLIIFKKLSPIKSH